MGIACHDAMDQHQRFSCLAVAFTVLVGMTSASAQTAGSRVEVGAQFSALRLADSDPTNAGIGGRFSYYLADWASAEAELNYFPSDRLEVGASTIGGAEFKLGYSRRRIEAFFGPKIGFRGARFGLFGKVRPGFSRLSDKGVSCIGPSCAFLQLLLARAEYRTELALNLGGVFEFYPTSRTVARLDLGTTMIRHRSAAPPCRECTRRNFASGLGFGYRF
jgi:hypothetical protein